MGECLEVAALLVRGQGDGVIGSTASRGASRSFLGATKKFCPSVQLLASVC